MYKIPVAIYKYLETTNRASGAEISRVFGIPDRTARRYVQKFNEGEAFMPFVDFEDFHFKPQPRQFRPCVVDIETTNFAATGNRGQLLCCSYLPLDASEPYTISRKFGDETDERVLREVIDELSEYDMLIGHYLGDGGGRGFDLSWLNTRRQLYGMPGMRTWFVYDTYYEAKRVGLRVQRKSLAFLADHFRLKQQKTSIYPREWNEVFELDKTKHDRALYNIIDHCEKDVTMNRDLYWCLYPRSLGTIGYAMFQTKWRGEPQ